MVSQIASKGAEYVVAFTMTPMCRRRDDSNDTLKLPRAGLDSLLPRAAIAGFAFLTLSVLACRAGMVQYASTGDRGCAGERL